jgi:hypothetical protein
MAQTKGFYFGLVKATKIAPAAICPAWVVGSSLRPANSSSPTRIHQDATA